MRVTTLIVNVASKNHLPFPHSALEREMWLFLIKLKGVGRGYLAIEVNVSVVAKPCGKARFCEKMVVITVVRR